MTPENIALITEWHRARASLKQWEEYERQLRDKVVATMFGDYGDGSRAVDIGNGYTLENVNTTKHEVKASPELDAMIKRIGEYKPTATLADTLLVWKPTLSVRAYKLLPAEVRAQFDHFVTTKPQAPQLKIVGPKE